MCPPFGSDETIMAYVMPLGGGIHRISSVRDHTQWVTPVMCGWPPGVQALYERWMRPNGAAMCPTWGGLKASMSGKGNCYDNAAIETFFKTIKAELIWHRTWEIRRQAEIAIFQYIYGFYNPRRRQSALGGKSALAFERQVD